MSLYIQIDAADIPLRVRFDTPDRLAGCHVEISYGGVSDKRHDYGAPFKRVTDGGKVTYYRLELASERTRAPSGINHRVKIDGVETTLTYDCYSGSRGHQYLTPGATSSHAFPERLVRGQAFRTSGHHYEVLT